MGSIAKGFSPLSTKACGSRLRNRSTVCRRQDQRRFSARSRRGARASVRAVQPSSAHFTRAFALAIALPVAPDDLLCYIAGTTRMTWRTYVAIILLCKPWALIAYGLGVSALLLRFLPW